MRPGLFVSRGRNLLRSVLGSGQAFAWVESTMRHGAPRSPFAMPRSVGWVLWQSAAPLIEVLGANANATKEALEILIRQGSFVSG